MAKKYDADDILVLEGLEPVRKRPGMYIGSTGTDGLHHLLVEIFDNSRDEAMNGRGDEIEVALLPDDVVRVADNGAGIPVAVHSKTKVSALELVMTRLHAGGKFEGKGYRISGGLHGVGASVVNALSEWLRVHVYRDGGQYFQAYERGRPVAPVKKLAGANGRQGTVVTFKPDRQIFSELVYDWSRVVNHLRGQAYLVKGLRVRVIDARLAKPESLAAADDVLYLSHLVGEWPSQTFYFEGGIVSLVKFRNQGEKPVHKNVFYLDRTDQDIQVEIALQYVDDITAREITYANNTITPEGGMHLTGFRTALTRTLNDYAKKNNLLKEADGAFAGEDVREGVTAVISAKLPNPQFEGQTKAKLGNVEVRSAVENMFGESFALFLEEHPDDARAIVGKVALALRARKAAKAAKDSVLRKGALEGFTLPGKLADCSTRQAEEAELFIVEGDSAGGTSKQGRDRRIQAILPLRGKILNVERFRLDKILASKEIRALVIALGTAIGESFDLEKLRYHKIVIATDADVDGAHIRTLLLTLFYRYLQPIIEGGFLYIAQPPLYKIRKGKAVRYAYNDREKERVSRELKTGAGELAIQRYKGLGEMNAEELWETTMDPERRLLKQVTATEAAEADKIFTILMGAEVAPRKAFIQAHAKLATLDI